MHIAAAGDQSYRLLARVDQIPVDFVVTRRRPDTENPVLAVQHDLTIRRYEIGNQRRQPDTEVYIGTVDEVLGGPPRDLATFERHRLPLQSTGCGSSPGRARGDPQRCRV